MKKQKKFPLSMDKIMLHDDFIRYVKKSSEHQDKYFNNEFENNPDLKEEFKRAVQLHKILGSHKKSKYPEEYKDKQLSRLLSRINTETKADRFMHRRKILRITQIAAAIFVILATVAILLIQNNVISIKKEQQLQVIVPSGEKSQLILPDGTQVWLNSESKLVYPADFTYRERKVTLEGEAYFDVAKVNNSRFTVYTQDFKVEVLGTKFNVKSYPDDYTVETTVVEGMVKVESEKPNSNFFPIILKPTERLVYKKDIRSFSKNSDTDIPSESKIEETPTFGRKEILISHVNTNNITSWKDYLLVFDNESFEEIALKLSRWYKVQIFLQDEELKTQHYTGKFVHNESLTQVLEAIRLTTPIKYQIYQNRVEISIINENIDLDKPK